jgi:predicted transcriptional regulator
VLKLAVDKRSKLEIYIEVLDLFYQEGATTGKAHLTTVAHQAKIPYHRFQKIVSKFIESDLILQTETGFAITANGLCCLQRMQQANYFFREMGLNL